MAKEKEIDVRYLNREFDTIKEQIINFAKAYYPDTFNDFSEGSIGLAYIEMASYVGDVLSFYTDTQFKESFIQYADERANVVDLAGALGYRVKPVRPATTELDVYLVVPSRIVDGDVQPDFRFAPVIESNMIVGSSSRPNIQFRTLDEVDFREDSDTQPLEVSIFERNENTGDPASYLLKKRVRAVAGTVRTETFTFGDPEPYVNVALPEDNVIDVIDVRDSDDNKWFQVPYLAQETIFEEFRNTDLLDPNFSEFGQEVRYMLDLVRTPRRFTVRVRSDNTTTLQFGSGVSRGGSEKIVPNPLTIGNPQLSDVDNLELPLDPSNFLSVDTYGQIPFNTTLEVTYATGGGQESNVPIGDLTEINSVSFDTQDLSITSPRDRTKFNRVQNSISVRNSVPATGGGPPETVEEIRRNAQAFFSAQDRAVTTEDYIVRAKSMPARYGSVAKVFVTTDEVSGRSSFQDNPLAINMYVLGLDENGSLTQVNDAVKQNLRTYLSQYRLLTDAINIKDGFVVNVGINFDVVVFNTYSKREVLLRCIDRLKELFDISNQQFNQPIIIGQVVNELNQIPGVQNVSNFEVFNKFDETEGYSGNIYEIEAATRDGIIYPSLDPSVFEVRFPNKDIKGRAL